MKNINVACHNINGFCSSKPYVYELLSKCDIVGISEHWLSGPELYHIDVIANQANMNCTYKCSNNLLNGPPEKGRGYGGVAIFWNNTVVIASPISDIKSDRILGIEVNVANKSYVILNVYLPSSKVSNGVDFLNVLSELEELSIEHSPNSKIIIMGDFNCKIGDKGGPRGEGPCCAYGSRLLDIMSNDLVQFVCCDMSHVGSGPMFTFDRPGIGRSWIDHIFVSSNMFSEVIKCEIINDELLNVSDHLPVSVTISVVNKSDNLCTDSNKSVQHSKILWHKLNVTTIGEKYTNATHDVFLELYNDVNNAIVNIDIDLATNIITDNVLCISDKSLGRKHKAKKGNAKPFWSKELTSLCKLKKKAYSNWVSAGKPVDPQNTIFKDHVYSKKCFRKAFRQAEAKFRSGIEEKIDACNELDQRQFWYLLKKDQKSRKQHGTMLRNLNGEIISDDTKILDMWREHFENLGKPSEHQNFDDGFKSFVESQVKKFNDSELEMDKPILADPITDVEVDAVCKKLKSGKCQDFTGLSYEHFKYAGKSVYIVLAMLFNAIISCEKLPKEFLKGVTIPLFKGGNKDPLSQDDYRGITIQNVLCKVYDTIIMNRSADTIKKKVGICDTQCACEKGVSSVNASLLLQETISHNVECKKEVYVTYFDTRKAFDTVWIDGLFYMLYCHGIKGKLWRLLRYGYMNSVCSIFLNGCLSPWFRLFQGVKQGAVASMLLYICFINVVIKELLDVKGCQLMGINTSCIGYADDIAVTAINVKCAQRMVNIAYELSSKWRFEFNVKKCALMYFSQKSSICNVKLGDKKIEAVNEYTHVGIMVRSRGKPNLECIKQHVAQSKRAFYSVIGCSLHKCGLSPLSLSKIYWNVAVPKLLAGAEVKHISSRELEEYEKFHCSMAKDIQNIPQNAPNISALAMLGWLSLSYYIDYIRLMFIYRLLMLPPTSINRQIPIKRFYFILTNGVYSAMSPIARCIKVLAKYGLLYEMLQWLESGMLPSKSLWRKMVKRTIMESYHSNWRFEISLYPKLRLYRIIQTCIQPSCWWLLAKSLPFLKRPCCTMIRLLCGSNVLAVYKRCEIAREERVCKNCTYGDIENVLHFVMQCPKFTNYRQDLLYLIESSLSCESTQIWERLSDQMKLFIIFGLQFPFKREELYLINYFSCIVLHKMYIARRSLEPP